jgi:hypothetical protein
MFTKEMPCVSKYNLKTDENYNKWALADNNMIPQFIPELTNANYTRPPDILSILCSLVIIKLFFFKRIPI